MPSFIPHTLPSGVLQHFNNWNTALCQEGLCFASNCSFICDEKIPGQFLDSMLSCASWSTSGQKPWIVSTWLDHPQWIKTQQGLKSDLALLQKVWSADLCAGTLVLRRSLEIIKGCLCCPSGWQPLGEGGNEWWLGHMPVPRVFVQYITSRRRLLETFKVIWVPPVVFGFPVDRILPRRG